jgi:predicted lipoprotein
MTFFMERSTLSGFLFIAVALCGCGGGANEPSPADNAKDRQIMLTHWADDLIVPAYEGFQVSLGAMVEAADAFSAGPDASSLVALRDAWANAYVAWQKVELYEFGPADKYTLRNFFNIYPADINGISSNIDNPSANLDLPASYAQQGFPALDYLVNGTGGDDVAIVSYYTDAAHGAQRLAYVNRISTRMNTLLGKVISEWKGTYRDTFVSKTGLDIGSSTGLVVNAFTLYYERYVRSGKIGIPSGAALGPAGTSSPERVEALYKRDISSLLAKTAHAAAADFFNGMDANTGLQGPSFQSYLDALGAKDAASGTPLSQIINDQFAIVTTQLDGLLPDFYEQIETDNDKMISTYAAMQKLVRLLKVDMTSAMSVTITYTDNDGD